MASPDSGAAEQGRRLGVGGCMADGDLHLPGHHDPGSAGRGSDCLAAIHFQQPLLERVHLDTGTLSLGAFHTQICVV